MKEAKRSLLATIGVIVVIGTVVMGGLLRNRMEIGAGLSVGEPITLANIVLLDSEGTYNDEASTGPIAESAFFYQLTLLLEREFVDPVEHNEDLAVGAVRGMVNSLADSYSVFYSVEQMSALNARRNGVFEGIGVEIRLQYNEEELAKLQNYLFRNKTAPDGVPRASPSRGADSDVNFDPVLLIPSVVVATVAEGSPADLAGLKAGDRITHVNDKWAISSIEVLELRAYQARFDLGEMTADEFQTIREDFRKRGENSILPSRASDQLMLGTSGEVNVEWDSVDGDHRTARVLKSKTSMSAVVQDGEVTTLRFFESAFDHLQDWLWPEGPVTLDLRSSTLGDYNEMRDCLGFFAGRGKFGVIERSQAGRQRTLQTTGTPFDHDIKLIVDKSTWGAAAVFASALVSSGKAEIVQGELTRNLPWVRLYELPGGSGYTLKTGTFKPTVGGTQ